MQQQTSLLFALVITGEDDECGELTTISDYTCDNNVCNHESSGCGDVTCINGGVYRFKKSVCLFVSVHCHQRAAHSWSRTGLDRTSRVRSCKNCGEGWRALKADKTQCDRQVFFFLKWSVLIVDIMIAISRELRLSRSEGKITDVHLHPSNGNLTTSRTGPIVSWRWLHYPLVLSTPNPLHTR